MPDFRATISSGSMDARKLRGKTIDATAPTDGQGPRYDAATDTVLWRADSVSLLVFGNTATANAPATEYLDPGGGGRAATANEAALPVRAGKVAGLRLRARTGPTGGTIVVTVRKNGTDQTLTATLAIAGTSITDLTHSFTTVEGDYVSVKAVSGTGVSAGAVDLYVSLEFTPI